MSRRTKEKSEEAKFALLDRLVSTLGRMYCSLCREHLPAVILLLS